jgi:hypothetical protein
MAKLGSIQIHDVIRRVKEDGVRVTKKGYMVKSVGKNGEILQCSEVLNDTKAVKTHITAMNKLWNNCDLQTEPLDCTKEQKFVKSGFAASKI